MSENILSTEETARRDQFLADVKALGQKDREGAGALLELVTKVAEALDTNIITYQKKKHGKGAVKTDIDVVVDAYGSSTAESRKRLGTDLQAIGRACVFTRELPNGNRNNVGQFHKVLEKATAWGSEARAKNNAKEKKNRDDLEPTFKFLIKIAKAQVNTDAEKGIVHKEINLKDTWWKPLLNKKESADRLPSDVLKSAHKSLKALVTPSEDTEGTFLPTNDRYAAARKKLQDLVGELDAVYRQVIDLEAADKEDADNEANREERERETAEREAALKEEITNRNASTIEEMREKGMTNEEIIEWLSGKSVVEAKRVRKPRASAEATA